MEADKFLLLVEDEPLVALAMQDALEEAGYRVLMAEDGHTGTALLAENVQKASALITDIRLGGGPDGWMLAREARASCPDLPVLYVTGDSAQDWGIQGVSGSTILQKPFVPDRMLTELRDLLT
jgi:DNA-binding response OmpR family regulator